MGAKRLLCILGMLAAIFVVFMQPVYAINQFDTPATKLFGQSAFASTPTSCNRVGNNRDLSRTQSPQSVTTFGGKLFVSDRSGGRVLIYNTIPALNNTAPDLVIGQTGLCERSFGTSAYRYNEIRDVFAFNGQLFMGDRFNNRVLIYNSIPTVNDRPADLVLGQSSMNTNTVGVSSTSFNEAHGVATDGTRLVYADFGNNRVLLWNSIPTSSNVPADVVLGQPDMTSNVSNNPILTANARMARPWGVAFAGSKLIITDYGNSRILIFNTIPTTNGAVADVILTQSGGSTFSNAAGIYSDGTKLFVADYMGNRVLIYLTVPTSSAANADIVLGQPNSSAKISNNGGLSASSLSNPFDVTYDGTRVYVADYLNSRTLIWNTLPAAGTYGTPADVVLGQNDMTTLASVPAASSQLLYNPAKVSYSSGYLVVADTSNHRVLVINNADSTTTPAAVVVVGQVDFSGNLANQGGAANANTLSGPNAAFFDGSKLYIADTGNNRVLVYNSMPTSNNASADYVIGQSNFTTVSVNQGNATPGSTTLRAPRDISANQSSLMVSDMGNNRVLLYDKSGLATNQPASVVIGQADFISAAANRGSTATALSLNGPYGATLNDEFLFVSDTFNNRILRYTLPASSNQSADVVIGQPNFTSQLSNQGNTAPTFQTIGFPMGLVIDGTRLLVGDYSNNRVLIFNTIPAVDNASGDALIGQANSTSRGVNRDSVTSNVTLANPMGVTTSANYVIVSDTGNSRVLFYPKGPQNQTLTLPPIISSKTVTLQNNASQAKDMMVSENAGMNGAQWESYTSNKVWTFSSVLGVKNIYVRNRDFAHYEGALLQATTTLVGATQWVSTPTPDVSVPLTTITPELSLTPSRTPSDLVAVTIEDSNGVALGGAIVKIDGKTYTADQQGRIYIENRASGEYHFDATVDTKNVNGVFSFNQSLHNRIVIDITDKKGSEWYSWWWLVVLIFVVITAVRLYRSHKMRRKSIE